MNVFQQCCVCRGPIWPAGSRGNCPWPVSDIGGEVCCDDCLVAVVKPRRHKRTADLLYPPPVDDTTEITS